MHYRIDAEEKYTCSTTLTATIEQHAACMVVQGLL